MGRQGVRPRREGEAPGGDPLRVETRVQTLRARRSFKIATGATDAFSIVLVEIHHEGQVGVGEASPSRRVTGEDVESVLAFVGRHAADLARADPSEWRAFLADLHAEPAEPTARCAIDLALHDLVGKLRGVPARALHGLPEGRIETSFTVSLDAPDVMAEEAREKRAAGFRALKLKLGQGSDDLARVQAVRDAAPDARLRADANTGWSPEGAARLLPRLAALGVEFVEQPFLPAADTAFVELARASPIPLYADESVLGAADVARLHDAGFQGGVNLKLMKLGGLVPALDAIRLARRLGFNVQLGCNLETSIGIGGARQLLALLDHADLDGNLLLADDPFALPPPEAGLLTTPPGAGLGAMPAGGSRRAPGAHGGSTPGAAPP